MPALTSPALTLGGRGGWRGYSGTARRRARAGARGQGRGHTRAPERLRRASAACLARPPPHPHPTPPSPAASRRLHPPAPLLLPPHQNNPPPGLDRACTRRPDKQRSRSRACAAPRQAALSLAGLRRFPTGDAVFRPPDGRRALWWPAPPSDERWRSLGKKITCVRLHTLVREHRSPRCGGPAAAPSSDETKIGEMDG